MNSDERRQQLIQALRTFGDPRRTLRWSKGKPDYVKALELTKDDVPVLIETLRQWPELREFIFTNKRRSKEASLAAWAPVHAWRALARLRARAAVKPMLAMLDRLDEIEDDFYTIEFPQVFGWIGPPAARQLERHLLKHKHPPFVDVALAEGLTRIATAHPRYRKRVVATLMEKLERYRRNDEDLNALLICNLYDLRAVEAEALIDRVFRSGNVNEIVCGSRSKAADALAGRPPRYL